LPESIQNIGSFSRLSTPRERESPLLALLRAQRVLVAVGDQHRLAVLDIALAAAEIGLSLAHPEGTHEVQRSHE